MFHIGTLAPPCAVLVACTAFAGNASADCTCRAGGENYELGQTVCLSTPQGFRLAVCAMVLNNTSWKISSDACVSAGTVKHQPVLRSLKTTPQGS